VTAVEQTGPRESRLDVRADDGRSYRIQARYVVDASGRDAFISTKRKLRRKNQQHQSAAIFGHFRGAERRAGADAGNISIYGFEHGWMWMIPLPDGVMSVGAVCRPDYLKQRKGRTLEFLLDTLKQSPALWRRIEHAALIDNEVRVTGNYSYDSRRMGGPGWVLVGDAFAFLDPVFSSGVYLAMSGAEQAAHAVDAALREPGREAALLLSAAGARVMIVSRNVGELSAVGLEYVAADLGTPEGCALAVAETERRLGPIDLLVVNHGIGSAHERLVWEQDPEVWRETMRINLDGPFELARLTVGGMCKRGFGRLVFTSSTAGEKAERSGSAYTASKHGVIGLARAVAQDAGPFGVTSNAVLPGWVRTAMAERSAMTEAERSGISVEQVWRARAAIYPQNRVLEPREVAQVIAFLCSDAAGGVNGEAITVALGGIW